MIVIILSILKSVMSCVEKFAPPSNHGGFFPIKAGSWFRCVSLAAGKNMGQLLSELDRGVDIVTGGVGRVLDMVETRKLSTNGLNFIVIDEAVSNSQEASLQCALRHVVCFLFRIKSFHRSNHNWSDC